MTQSDTGFILLHRSIFDWEWYDDLNTFRLFIYCLLRANFKDGRFEGICVKRGSFVSSLQKLSDATGLTMQEVRTALAHLKKTGEITIKSTSKYSVITVQNYDFYQGGNTKNNRSLTGKPQGGNRRLTTEEKRERTGNNVRRATSFYNFPERENIDYEDVQNKLIQRNFSDDDEDTSGIS